MSDRSAELKRLTAEFVEGFNQHDLDGIVGSFAEVETDRVMENWTLSMDVGGNRMKMRGSDLLQFRGDKLVKRLAYCTSAKPRPD